MRSGLLAGLTAAALLAPSSAAAEITPLWDYARTIVTRFDDGVARLRAIDMPGPEDLPRFIVRKYFWPDPVAAWDALLPVERKDVNITGAEVIATSDQFGAAVEDTTQVPTDGEVAARVLRDCAKNALDNTAFDLWWASASGHRFDINSEIKQAIIGCLATYTEAAPQLSRRIAYVVTAQIATGILAVEKLQDDFATLSNWMRALQGFLPA